MTTCSVPSPVSPCRYAPRHCSARRAARLIARRVASSSRRRLDDGFVDVDNATRTRRAFLANLSVATALATVPFGGAVVAAETFVQPLAAQLVDAKATRVRVMETTTLSGTVGIGGTSSLAVHKSLSPPLTSITVPMRLDRAGTYVVEYEIGGTTVRGVLDTGSPFITMEARCSEVWGCLRERDAHRSGFDDTFEVYGLQQDGVTRWVLGDVTFTGVDGALERLPDTNRTDESTGTTGTTTGSSGIFTDTTDTVRAPSPTRTQFSFPELSFGVTSETTGRAGSSGGGVASAPNVGLVKHRKNWIRPTFLEQTDVKSFSLDFEKDQLTLSRVSLIPRSTKAQVFPLVDLRPLGAPVFHYAVRVDELWINGGRYRPSDGVVKPIYAVFDSGVTGCLVSKKLFYDSAFQFGTYESHVRVRDENGTRNSIGTSLQTCTGRCLFLAIPVDVEWVGFEDCHILFLGLAFMYGKGGLTVDIDDERVTLGRA